MRATALRLRNFLSKLHPPTPVTARQSTALLNLLDKSFRQQLDEAHPPPQLRHADVHSSPSPAEASRPTDSHIDSVLHHPYLEAHWNESAQLLMRRGAVDRFEASLRAGTLTSSRLQEIAREYLEDSKLRPAGSSEPKLGHKIAAWLASEPASTQSALFCSPGFPLRYVVPLMYTDDLEDVVWGWLRSLLQRDWVADPSKLSSEDAALLLDAEDKLVSEMMRMSLQSKRLNDAALQYVAASRYRQQSGTVGSSSSSSQELQPGRPLIHSYKRIATAILHRRAHHDIDGSVFDQVLLYAVPFTHNKVITRSFLQLYHATAPTADALYSDLRNEDFSASWRSWHSKHPALHRAFLIAILDAAQLSLQHQKRGQARFFLTYAEINWPAFIPSTKFAVNDSSIPQIQQLIEKIRLSTSPNRLQGVSG